MIVPTWGRAALGALQLAEVLAGPRASGAELPAPSIAVTIVAGPPCAPQLRERVAEQLADLAGEISWDCRPRLKLEGATRAAPGPHIWIDLSPLGEGQLTLRDADGQRFVVRRVPLANGPDEVGREAIAQIVRSAALALFSDKSETLTREQAEATLSTWSPHATAEPRPPEPSRLPAPTALHRPRPDVVAPTADTSTAAAGRSPPGGRPVFEIGPAWSSLAFSRQIPLIHEVALSLAISDASGPLAFWIEGGYRLPATYDGDPVGVSLDALTLRLGPSLGVRAGQSIAFTFAVGASAEWSAFTPRANSNGGAVFVPAPDGRFFAFSGRISWSVAYLPNGRTRLGFAFRLFCDAAPDDVHYDYRDSAGITRRVLSPFPIRPGIGLLITWRSEKRP